MSRSEVGDTLTDSGFTKKSKQFSRAERDMDPSGWFRSPRGVEMVTSIYIAYGVEMVTSIYIAYTG
jgi:hypothetical protein